MDFNQFKDIDSAADKATFTAKIDNDVYEQFQSIKKEHKRAGCVPYLIHDIVQEMLVKLTEQMQLDIEETKK